MKNNKRKAADLRDAAVTHLKALAAHLAPIYNKDIHDETDSLYWLYNDTLVAISALEERRIA